MKTTEHNDYNKSQNEIKSSLSNDKDNDKNKEKDGGLREDFKNMKNSFNKTAQHVKEKSDDACQEIKDKTLDAQNNLINYVKENPVKSIGTAMLVGFISAILLRK